MPFIFVEEFGMMYKELMRSSMYCTMSLEQRWERDLVAVMVDVSIKSEAVMLGGTTAAVRWRWGTCKWSVEVRKLATWS